MFGAGVAGVVVVVVVDRRRRRRHRRRRRFFGDVYVVPGATQKNN